MTPEDHMEVVERLVSELVEAALAADTMTDDVVDKQLALEQYLRGALGLPSDA